MFRTSRTSPSWSIAIDVVGMSTMSGNCLEKIETMLREEIEKFSNPTLPTTPPMNGSVYIITLRGRSGAVLPIGRA
jgi:hypothetical protein